jgi:hypothetical protein
MDSADAYRVLDFTVRRLFVEWRPSVVTGAGSGDPRTTMRAQRAQHVGWHAFTA